MSRIFRKQRYKLLLKQRLKKYISYAFGEILLVVIGILIALQLNNWNEQRKLQHDVNQLQQQLYQELSDTHKYLQHTNNRLLQYIGYLEWLIVHWSSLEYEKVYTHIPSEFAKQNLTLQFYFTSYSQFYDPKHSIFDEALYDGSMSSMDVEFVAALNEVYVGSNARINQLIQEEYILGNELNNYIDKSYGHLFLNAKRDEQDWSENTYQLLLAEFRNDGVLRAKLDSRLQRIKSRLLISNYSLELVEDTLEKFKAVSK
ncbi:hypothetical protein [Glaciecola sp. 1036]|uniref:hypothetical protein n=1 Tax=Alteromonadaceae TaxID=72275 RepID=UPI003D058AA3